jgi:lipoate-protein ligase A
VDLVTTSTEGDPAADMALTESMLRAVAAGTGREAIRIFRPGAAVAFGRSDRVRRGFPSASRAAVAHGRTPVIRLAGGHAAPYDPDCVVVEIVRREATMLGGIDERYGALSELLREALAGHGVEVEIGERPGEYCPGRFSLHLAGGPKVAGIAQRIIKGASLTSAVLVVAGGDGLRATIEDVYAALELPVDVRLAGALSDGYPGLTAEAIAGTVRTLAVARYRVD